MRKDSERTSDRAVLMSHISNLSDKRPASESELVQTMQLLLV